MKRFLLVSFIFVLVLAACEQSYELPPDYQSTITPLPTWDFSEPTAAPTETPTTQPIPIAPTLHRGVNFGNMLEPPNEGDWGLYVEEHYFDLVKEAGFDFIRLPVRWNTHAEEEYPYTIDPTFFFRVDQVVDWALERDLTIIVDFHHYEEMMWDPWSHKDRFLGITKQVAEHYKDYPSNVLFELLNEPNDQLDAQLWNGYLVEALAIVRETNPTRDVVIGPVNWNSPDWLSTLDVPADSYLIATFHYYSPFEFTHQGAEWNPDAGQWLGTTWTETAEQKADVIRTFDSVSEWAARNNIRILLGEFGAYNKAPQDSRLRWTAFIRSEAERHDFAWAYWELAAGFGVYDPEAKVWREDLLRALIP